MDTKSQAENWLTLVHLEKWVSNWLVYYYYDMYLQYEISKLHYIDVLITSQCQRVVHLLCTKPSLVLTLYLIDTHRNVNHCLRSVLNDVMTISIRWMVILNILFTRQPSKTF